MPKKPAPASEEAIRALAHQMWEDEGRPEGLAELHWQRATAALAEQANQKPVKKPARKAASPTAKTKTSKPKAR